MWTREDLIKKYQSVSKANHILQDNLIDTQARTLRAEDELNSLKSKEIKRLEDKINSLRSGSTVSTPSSLTSEWTTELRDSISSANESWRAEMTQVKELQESKVHQIHRQYTIDMKEIRMKHEEIELNLCSQIHYMSESTRYLMHSHVKDGINVTQMCHKLHIDMQALCNKVDFLIQSLKYGDELKTLSSRLKEEGSSVAADCAKAMEKLEFEIEDLEEEYMKITTGYHADVTFCEESYAKVMALNEEKITTKAQAHMAANLEE